MSTESSQKKLSQVRRPRVHITYDVEVGGALESKELPMILGVIGDFSGQSLDPIPRFKDRRLIGVDRDNLNDVIKSVGPRLVITVPNRLEQSDRQLTIELNFTSLDDFGPDALVAQVAPLRQLLAIRTGLSDLRNKMMGNDRLEEALYALVRDNHQLACLQMATLPQETL